MLRFNKFSTFTSLPNFYFILFYFIFLKKEVWKVPVKIEAYAGNGI